MAENVKVMEEPEERPGLMKYTLAPNMLNLSSIVLGREFAPQVDITPLESVWINALFTCLSLGRWYWDNSNAFEQLESRCPGATRHFK